MDPNLFHLDWDRVAEAMAAIVLLALFLERALSLVFEHRYYIETIEKGSRDYKAQIAYLLALAVCAHWKIDVISLVVLRETHSWFGVAITAGIIAGGSKGSLKLFQDVLDIKSKAVRRAEEKTEEEEKNPKSPSPETNGAPPNGHSPAPAGQVVNNQQAPDPLIKPAKKNVDGTRLVKK